MKHVILLVAASIATPTLAQEASVESPIASAVLSTAIDEARLDQLRTKVRGLEGEMKALRSKPSLRPEQELRLAQLPSVLVAMRKAEEATASALKSVREHNAATATDAAAAALYAAAAKQSETATAVAAKSMVSIAAEVKEKFSFFTWTSAAAALFSLLAVGLFFWLWSRVVALASQVAEVLRTLRVFQRRFATVDIQPIEDSEPHRTRSQVELEQTPLGTSFDYWLRVNGQIARYKVTAASEGSDGVMLVCEQITRGVSARLFHRTLCQCIEDNGGMHRHVALAA